MISASFPGPFSELSYDFKSSEFKPNFGKPSEPSSGDPCGVFWLPCGFATIPGKTTTEPRGGHYFGPIP